MGAGNVKGSAAENAKNNIASAFRVLNVVNEVVNGSGSDSKSSTSNKSSSGYDQTWSYGGNYATDANADPISRPFTHEDPLSNAFGGRVDNYFS